MGGSSSKNKSTVIAETLNKVMVSSMQNCSNYVDLTQELVVKGDGNVLSNVQMNQVFSSIMTCVNKTEWMTKLQNDLTAAVKQSAESQSVALLGVLGNSDAEVDNYIRNSIENSINVSTMSSLVNNIKQKQSIYVEGVGNTLINISMNQMNTNISSSTQELIGTVDVLNKIASSVDQKAKSTQEDPIANLLKGLSDLISGPIMWVAIMLIGGLIIFVVFLNTGAGQSLMDAGINYVDPNQSSEGSSDEQSFEGPSFEGQSFEGQPSNNFGSQPLYSQPLEGQLPVSQPPISQQPENQTPNEPIDLFSNQQPVNFNNQQPDNLFSNQSLNNLSNQPPANQPPSNQSDNGPINLFDNQNAPVLVPTPAPAPVSTPA